MNSLVKEKVEVVKTFSSKAIDVKPSIEEIGIQTFGADNLYVDPSMTVKVESRQKTDELVND